MMINYKQLTFAREYRGYSQTELSSKIRGLSQSNLSKFEKGLGGLSEDSLRSIMDYLEFPLDFLSINIFNKSQNAHYRKKAVLTKSKKDYLENSYRLIGYLIDQMSDSVEFPPFSFKEVDLMEGYTPESTAQYARRFLGLKDGPVRNIYGLLEQKGIIVVDFACEIEQFDGVSFTSDNGFKIIVINKYMSNDRKRFTIAHELGHIIMHSSDSFIYDEERDKEKEANRFACEFLMPAEFIKNSLHGLNLSYLANLKSYWLTSMASIIRRAFDLNCIPKQKYSYFNMELGRKNYKKNEPITVFIDSPSIFNEAYKLHINEIGYSILDLSNIFKLPVDVINKFFNNNTVKLKLHTS